MGEENWIPWGMSGLQQDSKGPGAPKHLFQISPSTGRTIPSPANTHTHDVFSPPEATEPLRHPRAEKVEDEVFGAKPYCGNAHNLSSN